jgi:DNA-binding LacI/PurR family transcriptional regulator
VSPRGRKVAGQRPNAASGLAGDLACEESFRRAVESGLQARDGEVCVVHHDGTPQNMHRRLNALFRRRHPPTGILVTGPKYTLGTLSFLLQRGFRLPDDVSLISRDSDPYLSFAMPTVARYSVDPGIFARKMSRIILRLAQGGTLPPQSHRVTPIFVPGETLG